MKKISTQKKDNDSSCWQSQFKSIGNFIQNTKPELNTKIGTYSNLFLTLLFLLSGFFVSGQTITLDGNPNDWPAVLNNPANIAGRIIDPTDRTDDIWTGGSKDIQQISQWKWATNGANDKNNISNVGFYLDGSVLYFFADRYANNGDAAIGIWILQSPVGKVGATGGTFSGVHQNGDILLISNFSNGGTNAIINAYLWENGALNTTPTPVPTAGLAAIVNSTSVPSPASWNYQPKNGVVGANYPTNTFFEGKIDLALLNTELDACLGTFLVETRNSTSLTAALEDIALGPLGIVPTCEIFGSESVCPNTEVTFSAPENGIYSWSISGDASIVGSTSSQNVTVATGDCGGSFVLSLTLTNQTGCTSSCSREIQVSDTENPIIGTSASNQTVECDGDGNQAQLAAWLASYGGATATDNCGVVNWSSNFNGLSDDCGATGSATVTFRATDSCGNYSESTATFTIVDTTNPSIDTQASDETVECDGQGNQAQLAAWLASNGGASASDVCSGVEWSNDFTALSDDCGATGSATVTFKATDDCGNYSETTATFTIVDTTNPSIDTQASDETVECDGNGNQAQLSAWLASNGGASASDVCSGVEWSNNFTALSDDCGATGSATVTFKATDDCGNYSETTATFTIVDTTNPSIDTQASDETVECDGQGNQAQLAAWLASNGGASASDVCSGVEWSNDFEGLSDDCGATGSATVTFKATDDCGNYSETTATFTIVDTTNPSIDTQASDETVECDGQGNQAQLAAWLASNGGASASDVCSGVEWSNDFEGLSDDCGATGSATVTFKATDDCGNYSETTATFTIVDTTNPSIDTQASDETVECDGDGNQAQLAAWLASNGGASASDVCSGVEWSNDFEGLSDDCGATGSATVTFKATDDCGNYSETTATFTIVDTINPSIDTPAADETVDCDGKGNQTQLAAWLASNGGASASDACSNVNWTNDFTSFDGNCGFVVVTFKASDDCGNYSETTATFTISTVDIVVDCPGDLVLECGEDASIAFSDWLNSFSYSGGCGTLMATDLSGFVLPNPGESLTITFEVTDECSQYVSCTATFTSPECFDGCTIGYWKNQTENWCSDYSTSTLYGSVFVNAPSELANLTLLEVLNLGGGGIYNLGRQSVAALLNICHEEVNYSNPYTNNIPLLISDVNAAFGQGGNPGALGSQLDLLNQVGCSIDAHGNTISERVVAGDESLVTGTMFTVYPIPFKDNITIKYGFDYQSNVTIELFDFMGTLVYKSIDIKPYLNKEETISTYFTERNSSQFYVIRITTDREVSTQTIVKSKK